MGEEDRERGGRKGRGRPFSKFLDLPLNIVR